MTESVEPLQIATAQKHNAASWLREKGGKEKLSRKDNGDGLSWYGQKNGEKSISFCEGAAIKMDFLFEKHTGKRTPCLNFA